MHADRDMILTCTSTGLRSKRSKIAGWVRVPVGRPLSQCGQVRHSCPPPPVRFGRRSCRPSVLLSRQNAMILMAPGCTRCPAGAVPTPVAQGVPGPNSSRAVKGRRIFDGHWGAREPRAILLTRAARSHRHTCALDPTGLSPKLNPVATRSWLTASLILRETTQSNTRAPLYPNASIVSLSR